MKQRRWRFLKVAKLAEIRVGKRVEWNSVNPVKRDGKRKRKHEKKQQKNSEILKKEALDKAENEPN